MTMNQINSILRIVPRVALGVLLITLAPNNYLHSGELNSAGPLVQDLDVDANKETDESDAEQDSKKTESTSYDPLKVAKSKVKSLDLDVDDSNRDREVPVKVYLPKSQSPAPVILFSHGLGGTRETCQYLADHWARRGYVCVFLQHPGSDDSVWKNERPQRIMAALKKAANNENFQLRTADVAAVLDQLETWNAKKEHPLENRLDLKRVGMSGHSFGAITTQAVSGQNFLGSPRYRDERILASIAMSPSSPSVGSRKKAFSTITIPWMSMTGTMDVAAIGGADVQSRLDVFENLPAGNKYQLVLHEGQHAAFTEIKRRGGAKKNPNHHRLILAFSTAFWDAWLKQDKQARQWLDSESCKELLEELDQWSKK